MKSKDIYIGTIKKCKDLYFYEKFGDERFVEEFQIGSFKTGSLHKYVDIVKENAILIKVSESKYIWVDLLTNKFEELLVNIGFSINTINTTPTHDDDFFVDLKTIQPVSKNNNLSIKKIKTLVKTCK